MIPICAGVDTLHVTAVKRAFAPPELAAACDRAQESHRPEPFEWSDGDGVCWAAEVTGGPHWLLVKCRDFDLVVPRVKHTRKPLRLELRAETLWTLGARRGTDLCLAAAASLVGCSARREDWNVSRADLCVDVHAGWTWRDTPRWVCKGHRVNVESDDDGDWEGPSDQYVVRRRFTGWSFSKGAPLSARVYNKSLQAPKGSPWIVELWKRSPYYRPDLTVMRAEFQVRTKALRELTQGGRRCETLADLWANEVATWRYLSSKWMRLSRTRRDRREFDPGWRWVSEHGYTPGTMAVVEPAVRQAREKVDLKRGLPQLEGMMFSVFSAAVQMGWVSPADAERIAKRGLDTDLGWYHAIRDRARNERIVVQRDHGQAVQDALRRRTPWADLAAAKRAEV